MKKVITDGNVPIKLWLDDIETGALDQAIDVSNMPGIFHHVAVMPDSHQGYGMPIGGVMALKNAVCPNAVGVDIGCGMSAMKTSINSWDTEQLNNLRELIMKVIPVGFSHHETPAAWDGFSDAPSHISVIDQELDKSAFQLGTLGGGNHFIEIQKDDSGNMWIMLHSGSRNFGKQIAEVYHKTAVELCTKWHAGIPNTDLAFLPTDTLEGGEYISAMNFAIKFAKHSRFLMIQSIIDCISHVFKVDDADIPLNHIDVSHNYARMESHYGHNVMVHRKGATSAKLGEIGIIPGSQGTASYIVSGLGNPESFTSCSHGAGRSMSRKQAMRELSLTDEIKILDDAGVIHGITSEDDLDEASGAYKNINTVMENQSDLVRIVTKLYPIAVVKSKSKNRRKSNERTDEIS